MKYRGPAPTLDVSHSVRRLIRPESRTGGFHCKTPRVLPPPAAANMLEPDYSHTPP